MKNSSFVYQKLQSKYFDYPVKVFALDHYKRKSAGEHEFSRKQVWFYIYGDDDLKTEFKKEFSPLFSEVIDNGNWDYTTLIPTHIEGEINENMHDLVKEVTSDNDSAYKQILRRNRTVKDNHSLDTFKQKAINLEESLDVREDVEGKNIILVDNICLTGCSFMHAAELLKQKGAENIICLTLGVKPRDDELKVSDPAEIADLMNS